MSRTVLRICKHSHSLVSQYLQRMIDVESMLRLTANGVSLPHCVGSDIQGTFNALGTSAVCITNISLSRTSAGASSESFQPVIPAEITTENLQTKAHIEEESGSQGSPCRRVTSYRLLSKASLHIHSQVRSLSPNPTLLHQMASTQEKHYGITPPISEAMPTPAELAANDALIAELKKQNNFEGAAETERRHVNVEEIPEFDG